MAAGGGVVVVPAKGKLVAYGSTPGVRGVLPATGVQGTPVTLTGHGFTGASGVRFGSAPARFTVLSDSVVQAVVPDGLPGAVDVSVAGPTGPSAIVAGDRFAPVALGGYVLDGWGALHPLGVGRDVPPPDVNGAVLRVGYDVAKKALLLPDKTGGYVLDGWGGLHGFGVGSNRPPAAVNGAPAWPGWDIGR